MHEEGIDLWASPAAKGPAPEGIKATGSPDMNLPWTHAGVPAVTLPMGRAENGLPLGLQLAASFGADEYLLAWSRRIVESMGIRGQGISIGNDHPHPAPPVKSGKEEASLLRGEGIDESRLMVENQRPKSSGEMPWHARIFFIVLTDRSR